MKNKIKILSCLLLSVFILSNQLFAQTRRQPVAPKTQASKTEKKPVCNGGWSGIVTFKKILKDSHESDNPGIRKEKDRIRQKTSRDYEYNARAIVDGSSPSNTVVNTNVNFVDKDQSWGEERVWDTCNSRENGHWFIIESSDNRLTTAQADGPARSFNLNVDEQNGVYHFNLSFPHAVGTYKREERLRRSGHCQPKNNEPWDRTTDNQPKIDGESFSVYGEKLDPRNPDTISGSKTWGGDKSFYFQVTWRFTRCPQKLLITDLKFEHPKFPDYGRWEEIPEQTATIDGNMIKIKAKVLNMSAETKFAEISFKETYKGDKYNGSMPDLPLKDSFVSVRLEAGEEREVEVLWNSEGYAWFDDGRPRTIQRIKAEAWEENKLKDEMTKNLKIAPKPLILVHGIWSSGEAFVPVYQNLMTATHSYDWKAYIAGADDDPGKLETGGRFMSGGRTKSVYDNADELAKFVRYAQENSNAWHVDIVAHSTGGLVARLFIHKHVPAEGPDGYPVVKHLLMLGTPNGGVPCIEVMYNKADVFKDKLQAAKELTTEEMSRFNQFVRNRQGAKFSALVGNSFPLLCAGFEWNDGFVAVDSARLGVTDFAFTKDMHTQLVDQKHFANFIRPHVVTGPRRTYPIPVVSEPGGRDERNETGGFSNKSGNGFEKVSYEPNRSQTDFDNENPQNFSKEVSLQPKQTVEIEMPVTAARNLGFTFMADASVAVSLVSDKGVVVAANPAGSPAAAALFRTLFTKDAVAGGVWKLRIENTSDLEQVFLGFSWSAENPPVGRTPVAE